MIECQNSDLKANMIDLKAEFKVTVKISEIYSGSHSRK